MSPGWCRHESCSSILIDNIRTRHAVSLISFCYRISIVDIGGISSCRQSWRLLHLETADNNYLPHSRSPLALLCSSLSVALSENFLVLRLDTRPLSCDLRICEIMSPLAVKICCISYRYAATKLHARMHGAFAVQKRWRLHIRFFVYLT